MKKILFLIVLLISTKHLHAQDPLFRHYTVSEGLSHSTVYFSMQDSKGFIWFCTESGVNRFDGRHFETFTIADGLADNENFKCYEDSKGRIWFLSYNGKLSYFKDTTFINEQKDPTLKYEIKQGKYLVDMCEDKNGNIWFSRIFATPYVYNGKKVIVNIIPNNLYPENCYPLFLYKNEISTLIFNIKSAHSQNYEIFRINLATKKRKLIGTTTESDVLYNIIKYNIGNNEFYFHTQNGVMNYKNDTITYLLKNNIFENKAGSSLFDRNNLWVSTATGLVFIPDFVTKGYVGNKKVFFDGTHISYIMYDNEGGMWITTLSDGIYYVPASQSLIHNFSANSVLSIGHHATYDLWATGNYYGDLTIYRKEKIIDKFHFFLKNAQSKGSTTRLKSIRWLSETKILLGTDYTPCVYDLTTRKLKPFVLEWNDENNGVGFSDMDEGERGLWITGRYGIFLWDYQNKPIPLYGTFGTSVNTNLGSMPLLRLISVANGGNKGCWYASIQNLYWFDFATCTPTFIAGEAIFKSNLRKLKFINGYLWIGTDGNGIFIFKDGKLFKHITAKNSKLISNICHKLTYDGNDNIWVATNKGISVFNSKTYTHIKNFSTNDVLPNDDVKDISLYNGKAYIATPSGATIIDIDKFVSKVSPPEVYIRGLSAEGKKYSHLVSPKFYYHNGIIVLSYSAITFQVNKSLQYRYRIKGENEKWNEVTTDRIEFYNLNPDTYTIEVSAKKYNSDWGKPAVYTFTVMPLWYQSWWLKIIITLIIGGLIYLWLYRVRKREEEKTAYHKRIAELKNNALASQMNPHFIFNTLNSLQTFVLQNKPLEANHYIARFSRLIRSIMNYSDTQLITLDKELEFLNLYIELEQLRFEEKFDIIIKVDENILPVTTTIPSLIIQPFVENSIKYGLSGKREKGLLEIIFEKKENYILVTINDNGIGRQKVAQQQAKSFKEFESKGIKYTEERLLLISGNIYNKKMVNITDIYHNGEPDGTKVELIIPILNG